MQQKVFLLAVKKKKETHKYLAYRLHFSDICFVYAYLPLREGPNDHEAQ
jgi:hypothetical protein